MEKKDIEQLSTDELLRKVYERQRRMERRLLLMVVGNYVRLFLILVPVILGIIYLPSFIIDTLDRYQAFLELGSGGVPGSQIQQMISIWQQSQISR